MASKPSSLRLEKNAQLQSDLRKLYEEYPHDSDQSHDLFSSLSELVALLRWLASVDESAADSSRGPRQGHC